MGKPFEVLIYRPGQSNWNFWISMLLMKKTSLKQGLTQNGVFNPRKCMQNCEFFILAILSSQLGCPGLYYFDCNWGICF